MHIKQVKSKYILHLVNSIVPITIPLYCGYVRCYFGEMLVEGFPGTLYYFCNCSVFLFKKNPLIGMKEAAHRADFRGDEEFGFPH